MGKNKANDPDTEGRPASMKKLIIYILGFYSNVRNILSQSRFVLLKYISSRKNAPG